MIHALVLAAALATESTTVPFSLESNHLIIEVTIDGKPTRAIFDTGGGNAIDPAFAKANGLRVDGHGIAGGVGESTVSAAQTRVGTLAVGPLTLREQDFAVLPLPGSMTGGEARPIDAIVGREILRDYVTRIDYRAHTLTFTPASEFVYAGNAAPIAIRLGGAPEVQAEIDGVAGTFQVDTGSSASLILTSPFVAGHGLREKYHTIGNLVVGRGVGGYTRADLARGRLLRIGAVEVADPIVQLSTDKRGVFASRGFAGNIGNDILSRFTLTVDYRRRAIYFEPDGALPPPPNRAGMYVQNDDRRFFEVVDAMAGGPAFAAGLRAGDRIVAIDGKPATAVTANDFWLLMRGPPGTTHTFELEGGRSLTLVLRDGV